MTKENIQKQKRYALQLQEISNAQKELRSKVIEKRQGEVLTAQQQDDIFKPISTPLKKILKGLVYETQNIDGTTTYEPKGFTPDMLRAFTANLPTGRPPGGQPPPPPGGQPPPQPGGQPPPRFPQNQPPPLAQPQQQPQQGRIPQAPPLPGGQPQPPPLILQAPPLPRRVINVLAANINTDRVDDINQNFDELRRDIQDAVTDVDRTAVAQAHILDSIIDDTNETAEAKQALTLVMEERHKTASNLRELLIKMIAYKTKEPIETLTRIQTSELMKIDTEKKLDILYGENEEFLKEYLRSVDDADKILTANQGDRDDLTKRLLVNITDRPPPPPPPGMIPPPPPPPPPGELPPTSDPKDKGKGKVNPAPEKKGIAGQFGDTVNTALSNMRKNQNPDSDNDDPNEKEDKLDSDEDWDNDANQDMFNDTILNEKTSKGRPPEVHEVVKNIYQQMLKDDGQGKPLKNDGPAMKKWTRIANGVEKSGETLKYMYETMLNPHGGSRGQLTPEDHKIMTDFLFPDGKIPKNYEKITPKATVGYKKPPPITAPKPINVPAAAAAAAPEPEPEPEFLSVSERKKKFSGNGIVSQSGVFGDLIVDMVALRSSPPKLKVRTKNGNLIINKIVDSQMVDMLTKNSVRNPDNNTISIFRQLVKLSKVDLLQGHPKEKYLMEKPKKTSSIIQIFSDPEQAVSRLEILVGSQNAGNSSTLIKNEISEILTYLVKESKLDKVNHKLLFEKYVNK